MSRSSLPSRTLCAFLLTWLTSCAHSVEASRPQLPPATADLRTCTDRPTAALPPGAWTAEQVTQIIGDVRRSELAKDRCARSWDSFYADLVKRLLGVYNQ